MDPDLVQSDTRCRAIEVLVSVRDYQEAALAFAAGVEVIDIKEPRNGSLGMADIDTIGAILEYLPSNVCISLALGELDELTSSNTDGMFEFLADSRKVKYVKIGLAAMTKYSDWELRWAVMCKQLADSITPVAVVYADHWIAGAPLPEMVIAAGHRLNCGAVLVDTYDKSSGNVFEHLDVHELTILSHRARQYGMRFVLAGSIDDSCISKAVRIGPDIIGVRGAVCRSGVRESEICFDAIKKFRQLIMQ